MSPRRLTRAASTLAVHPGALGDVILFGRLLSRLAGKVTLVAAGEKARLLAGAGAAAEHLDFEALPMHEVFTDAPPAGCRLPALLGRHERLLSCFGTGDRRAELRLAAMCGAADAAFLPVRPPEDFRGHLLDLWFDLLGLSYSARDNLPPWRVPADWRTAADEKLREAGVPPREPYVVIHPGSGSPAKCWPLENFVELAAGLARLAGRPNIVFVLGPVELDSRPGLAADGLRSRFPVLACPPLEVLAGVLASAAAYVGNDSGVSHLSAAVGTATTALFGPTRSEHFGPLGRSVRTIICGNLRLLGVNEVAECVRTLPELQESS